MIASQLYGYCDVINNWLWRDQQNVNLVSKARGRRVKIVVLSSFLSSLCRVRNKIVSVLKWRTVSALTRVLFWCLHLNNPLVSTETDRHSSTYIILYVLSERLYLYAWYRSQGPINNNPELDEIMAWCRTCDKPFYEPIMAEFFDAYMCGHASLSYTDVICEISSKDNSTEVLNLGWEWGWLTSAGIPIVKIKQSHGRLTFIMGIPISVKTVFILRRGHVEARGEHN